MRRVHFVFSTDEALIYRHENGGEIMTNRQHPDRNHKALKAFQDGSLELMICDFSMATGWRVEADDVEVTFDDGFPQGALRDQAKARVRDKPLRAGQLL